MILGSGLGPLAGQIEDAVCVPYGEVPHMRTSTATSHVGRFVCGVLGGIAGRCVNRRIPSATVDRLFIGMMGLILAICVYNYLRFT